MAQLEPSDLDEVAGLMRLVLDHDLGGYQERWHRDIDDLAKAYLQAPGAAMFLGRVDGVVAGTAAVVPCRLTAPPNPPWLVRRYSDPSVCQLARVWIHPSRRRLGVARELVRAAARWAVEAAGYSTVYLHTDASVTGAEPFWRSMPTIEVYDARPDPFHCVHFELDVTKLLGDGATVEAAQESVRG